MSKPFDATLKDLGASYPHDFVALFDQPTTEPLKRLNVDLSTVTTAGDLVLGIGEPIREIVHIEFQASADQEKGAEVLVYNTLLFRQYRVAVHSIVVLLRPKANHSSVNGLITYASRAERGKMLFQYEVFRVYERPVEELLQSPPGTLPLALLGALPDGVDLVTGLTSVAERVMQRLEQETTPEQTKRLLTAAFLLSGLRVRRDVGKQVFAGIRAMRESDTYLAILDEGREEEAKRILRLLGAYKFGQPSDQIVAKLEAISDIERLERIGCRILTASTWQELLDTP